MEQWVTTWGMAHSNISSYSPSYKNRTMRLAVLNNLNGKAVRVRFFNKEGNKPLKIGACTVENENVFFDEKTKVMIAPGEEVCSDPLPLSVVAGNYITISVAYQSPAISGNCISATVQCSPKGDYTNIGQFSCKKPNLNSRFFGMEMPIVGISSIEVLTEQGTAVICFGDSITQQSKWTGPLAEYLADRYSGQVSLINMGIGGNRLLHGVLPMIGGSYGEAGKSRFAHDVLDIPGAKSVIFALGTNDIGFIRNIKQAEYTTADMLIAEYKNLIQLCRDCGLKVFGTTIIPRYGTQGYESNQEEQRKLFNEWVRKCGLFDAVFDFDLSVCDPKDHARLKFPFDSGDHLHPSSQGGQQILKCILSTLEKEKLSLF